MAYMPESYIPVISKMGENSYNPGANDLCAAGCSAVLNAILKKTNLIK